MGDRVSAELSLARLQQDAELLESVMERERERERERESERERETGYRNVTMFLPSKTFMHPAWGQQFFHPLQDRFPVALNLNRPMLDC